MKANSFYFFISVALLFLSSCYTSNEVTKYDYSYLYDEDQAIISPKYKIFHHSQDSSTLFYELNSGDILYERILGDSTKAANIRMKYTLFADRDLTIVLDSGGQNLANYGANGQRKLLQNAVRFKFAKREVAWITVRFRDENKDFNVINILTVDKRENINNQYFNYLNGEQVLFDQRSISSKLSIQKSNLVATDDFIMETSEKSFNMTPPPFARPMDSELRVTADDRYSFSFSNDFFEFENPAFYNRFIAKNDSGLYNQIFFFGTTFPKLNQITEFIDPIRYISTSTEYKNLKAAVNPKKGLDAFWLKLGKNEANSKELLKEYYHRIEIANQFFTSYKEGWKTDRGIIYIIYGIPSSIRKNAENEVWLYGEENNVLSVQFRFYQTESSNISNHYEMVRNSDYKNNWYRQVDLWRQGKID
ncbi:MAG: GWxTD domain-containing protein [Vicingaceae bacterium]|jgi:GWxTD domain-containing protein